MRERSGSGFASIASSPNEKTKKVKEQERDFPIKRKRWIEEGC
jgi:hypothetical protein